MRRIVIPASLLIMVAVLPSAAVAATFLVTKVADTQDGSCDADCSLREAVDAANANAGNDTISVPTGSYILSHASGMLSVTDDVDVEGSGQTSTIFDGNDTVRVLDVASGVVATLSDLSIENGQDATAAGIRSDGDLTLTRVSVAEHGLAHNGCCRAVRNTGSLTLHDSHASKNGTGGITNLGALIVNGGTLSDNGKFDVGATESGAGLLNAPGATAVLNDTTLNGNVGLEAGAIYNQGALTLNRSTIVGSEGQNSCNAIFNFGVSPATYASLTLNNSTISVHTSSSDTVCSAIGHVSLYNSTISFNGGHQIVFFQVGVETSVLTIENSVIASKFGAGTNCSGSGLNVNSLGHNLADDSTCRLTGPGDQVVADAGLALLADNGGATPTVALLSGSPARDTGNDATCLATDQRGIARPLDGDADGTARCDVGAYEAGVPRLPALGAALPLLVGAIGLAGTWVLRRSRRAQHTRVQPQRSLGN
jgi:CSLREA domain-containing protein